MRLYHWFTFSIVSSVQCIVTFRCLTYSGEYPVCTRHATPDEFKDGKGADLMAKRAAHVRGDPGEVFNCVGESIKTKFANKVAERAYCCGREIDIHGNDDDVCSVPIYKWLVVNLQQASQQLTSHHNHRI
ncbi:hypothetical protein H4Q26_014301 [Puccinia striiformis f. sp. tritici PST-130]|uniref:Secreted protein n=2 Tax=Puccinia striiformis TaxID=27350 RepID=A0A0L0VM22_9BASI|nr:hypothetical protein H4Q26_014301 [Puccinia striiformis f. sp. tritici PST-130]KNF00040.1 hypothetical protein PSTG_06664 [Puccinia striiformis f. sp. tritici PST-78]POV99746.1 hypothetical protein PSTT_13561 [Puccinia striiformis]